MYRRAQAAMEFLMTYGWAILIMLVVISVLFFLGVFSPQTTVSKSCVLPAGFTCYEFDMDASGNIYLDIGQATGKTITVTGIGCAPSSPNATLNPNVQIPTGSHAIVTIGGTNCSGATNSNFKGKLLIQYTISGSSGTRSVTGDVSAPLIGNSSTWGSGSYSGGSSFLYRRQVTINTNVSSDLTDFPAYFILNTNSLISAGKMNNSCKDLRVLDSTMSSLLDYEIENNTCNTTSTVVWFRIPQTHANVSSLAYVFYGNNSTSDAQNMAGVWRNGYTAVYHLGDATDSLGTSSGTPVNVTIIPGSIGYASSFTGYYSRINFGASSALNLYSNISISARVNPSAVQNLTISDIFVRGWQSSNTGYEFRFHGGNFLGFRINPSSSSFDYRYSNPVVTRNVWQHLSVSYDGTNVSFFGNGVSAGVVAASGQLYASLTQPTHMAVYPNLYEYTLNGSIDELRVSSVARSGDWFKAEWGQTYSVGSEQVN